jgi:hypothetical protein
MIPQVIKYFRFEPLTDSDGEVYMAPPHFKFENSYYSGYDLTPFSIKYVIHKDADLQPDAFTITVDNYFFQNPTNSPKYNPLVIGKTTDPAESFNPSVNHVIAIGPIPDDYDTWDTPLFGTESYCYEDHKEYLVDGPVFGFVRSWNQVGADKIEITCTSFLKVLADYQSSTAFVLNEIADNLNGLQIYYEYKNNSESSSSAYFASKDPRASMKNNRYRIAAVNPQVDFYDKTPGYPKFEFFTGSMMEGYATTKIAWRLLQEVGWCREDYQATATAVGATPNSDGGQIATIGFINPFQRFHCDENEFNPIIMGTDLDSNYNEFQFKSFDTDGLRYEYVADTTGVSGTELIYAEKYFYSFDPSKQSLLFNLKNLSDSDGLYFTVTCCPRFIRQVGRNTTEFVWDFTPYGDIENLKKWGVSVGFHPKVFVKRNMAQVFDFDELITTTEIIYPVSETVTNLELTNIYRKSIKAVGSDWANVRRATVGVEDTAKSVFTNLTDGEYQIFRLPLVFNTVSIPKNAEITSAKLTIDYDNISSPPAETSIYVVGDSMMKHPLSTYSIQDFNKLYYENSGVFNVLSDSPGTAVTGDDKTMEITLNSNGRNNIVPGDKAKFMLLQYNDYDDVDATALKGITTISEVTLTVTYTVSGELNTYLEQLNIGMGPTLSYGTFNNYPDSDYKIQVLVKGIKWDKDQTDVINKLLIKYGQGQDYARSYIELPMPIPLEYFFVVDFSGEVVDNSALVTLTIDYIDDAGNLQRYYADKQYSVGASSYDVVRGITDNFRGNEYFTLIYTNDSLLILPLNNDSKTYWIRKYMEPAYIWPSDPPPDPPGNTSPVTVSISDTGVSSISAVKYQTLGAQATPDKATKLGYTKEFVQEEPLGFSVARDSQKLNGIRAAKISLPEVSNLTDVIKIADKVFRKLGREKYRCSVECVNSDNWQLPLFGLYNIKDDTHTKRVVNNDGAFVKFFIGGSPTSNGVSTPLHVMIAIPSPYSSTLVGFVTNISIGDSVSDILTAIETNFNSSGNVGKSISCVKDLVEGSITFLYDKDLVNHIDYKHRAAFNSTTMTTNANGLTIERIIVPPSQFKDVPYNEYLHLLSYDASSTKASYGCVFGIPNEELSNVVAQAINWIADVEKSA